MNPILLATLAEAQAVSWHNTVAECVAAICTTAITITIIIRLFR